jgi:hypothetical protein
MVFIGLAAGEIHASRIPLTVIGRNSIHTPVKVDAKLGVFKPLGGFIFQILPIHVGGFGILATGRK